VICIVFAAQEIDYRLSQYFRKLGFSQEDEAEAKTIRETRAALVFRLTGG
jgi:hypothetical protein